MRFLFTRVWAGIIPCLIWLACAGTAVHSPERVTDLDISKWIAILKQNPDDFEALRDLGSYLVEVDQHEKAGRLLKRAMEQNPNDPQVLYYVGSLFEKKNEKDKALRLYARYTQVNMFSPFRDLLEARYRLVTREKIHDTMRFMLENEELLDIPETAAQAIAVLPLDHLGLEEEYAALGKGLAEMIITDLNQVQSIQTVERIRVQALLDEMALGQTGVINEETAARFGYLLGAGKLLHGNFSVIDGNQLHLDVVFGDVLNQTFSQPVLLKDGLKNLFLLEKDLVFGIINEMGVVLTPEEREKIQRIPTKNIQAFMSYSMGLEMEDQGNYEQASEFYEQAVQLDANFDAAVIKSGASNILAMGKRQRSLKSIQSSPIALQDENPRIVPEKEQRMIINNRMQAVNQNIGGNFRPSVETRQSAEESQIAKTQEINIVNDRDDPLSLPVISDINLEPFGEALPMPPDPPQTP